MRGKKSAGYIDVLWNYYLTLFFYKRKHLQPHIHVRYQDEEAVIAIPDGILLEGTLKPGKMKLVQAWIEIHREELMADWELASQGHEVFKIEPLK